MENNKNKKSVKFQGDVLNFCDFIQVFVFTRNHLLKIYCNKFSLPGTSLFQIFWTVLGSTTLLVFATLPTENGVYSRRKEFASPGENSFS